MKDFGRSWRDGLAFLAIIDQIRKNVVDMAALRRTSNRARLETAFDVADRELGIARLLDPEVSHLSLVDTSLRFHLMQEYWNNCAVSCVQELVC